MKSKQIIFGIFIIVCLSTFFAIPISLENQSLNQSGLKTSQGEIFDNFYANYIFGYLGGFDSSKFDYNHVSGDLYNVTWSTDDAPLGTWLENKENRLISNSSGMSFNDGTHTMIWILTNLTISNITLITLDGVGDFPFQVMGDFNVTLFGIGGVEAWYLENLIVPGSYALYEKSTGLLIYGYFDWGGGYYSLQLTNTNMFSQDASSNGIPGFNLLLIIPTILLISIVLVKKKMKN